MRNSKLIIPVLSLVVMLRAAAAGSTNITISNSGFESGSLTGWSANSTSISASGDRAFGGSFYSCSFKDPTASFDGRRLNSALVNLVTATSSSAPSDHYAFSLSAWFYVVDETDGAVEDTKIQFYVKWYNALQQDLGNDTGYLSGTVLSAFDSWIKLELPLMAAPANAVYASVFIAVRETVNHNNDVYVDNVSFAYEALPAYLKTLGLRTFDPSSGDALKVFFPYSTPAGKASSCRIVFNLPTAPVTSQRVNVLVYDVKGRLVRAIIKGEEFLAQHYNYIWDGRDVNQEFLPVGMYIISVEVADQDTGGVIKEQTVVAIGRKL